MNRNQPTENDMIYAQAQTIMDFNARLSYPFETTDL